MNFKIVPTGAEFRVEPITDIGRSLAAHCRSHGENLTYPTHAGAEEAARQMETAIVNRHGRLWAVYAT
ncbi:hypothetical protein SCACP_21700 [Sporomusa carbonis]|uniref:hypothetical protein n=1 Tax=Sporomusa carbonis TaxID=3076075 RepID=UPI003A6D9ADA